MLRAMSTHVRVRERLQINYLEAMVRGGAQAIELTEPDRLNEILNTAHFDDIGFCFDIGHAHFGMGVRASFETMKERIRSTHLHDNHGDRDEHLWIGEGTIDWSEAMALLRSAPHVPAMLLEITGDSQKEISQGASESFSRLENALREAEKQMV